MDLNPDLDWYSAKMLDPDPDSINPDPKHNLGQRQTRRIGRDRGEETDWRKEG